MTISHHPDPATLMSYAAGSLAEPLSAVVASHVEMCGACRKDVRRLEALGAALLERVEPVAMATPKHIEPISPPATEARFDGVLPSAVVRLLGGTLDSIQWSPVALGVQQFKLPVSQPGNGLLVLLKVAAGKRIPEHGHGGSELTLVLTGGYSDVTGHYVRGDVADLDEHVEHQPIVDPDGECICLIASETKAQFKGVLPRLLQPIIGV